MLSDELFNLTTDVDVKVYQKVKCRAVLNDTINFKIYCYSDNQPIDLDKYRIEFRALLPKSNSVYSEVDNITKDGNILNITCDSFLCSEIGEVICSLRIWNTELRQKSSYQIIIKVLSTLSSDERINNQSLLSAVESLDLAINKYMELKVDLEDKIIEAKDLIEKSKQSNEILNTTINNASEINNTLNETIDNADNINQILTNTNNIANSTNTILNNTIDNAKLEDNKLTNINQEAIQHKKDLTDLINTADGKLEEFKNFDTSQIASRVGDTYNELYPEKELCTITHNLDCMPDIQLIYLSGAYGIGGYDESSYGGTGIMNKGSYKVEYIDNNILKIYIANNYYISDGVVVKDETNEYDYSYILTSETSNNSIIINIK